MNRAHSRPQPAKETAECAQWTTKSMVRTTTQNRQSGQITSDALSLIEAFEPGAFPYMQMKARLERFIRESTGVQVELACWFDGYRFEPADLMPADPRDKWLWNRIYGRREVFRSVHAAAFHFFALWQENRFRRNHKPGRSSRKGERAS